MKRLPEASVVYDVERSMWRLKEGYFYESATFGVAIPPGFPFDLASVPRLAWWIIAPFELSIGAAAVHDDLYRSGGRPRWIRAGGQAVFTRAEADLVFLEMMELDGVPRWRRGPAYRAVRLFGGPAWMDGHGAPSRPVDGGTFDRKGNP